MWSYLGALQHQCAGGNDGSFADVGIVEHCGSHADECATADGAGMNGGVVTDAHVILDFGRSNAVGHMHAGSVLHVDTVAHVYMSHITAHHGVEPDGTFIAHHHFAHNGGILAEITFFSPFWGKSFYRFYQCHFSLFFLVRCKCSEL